MVSSTQRVGLRVVWTGTTEQYYSMPENPRLHDCKCLNDSSNVEWRRRYGHGSQSSCSRHLFEFTFMLFFLAIIYHTWTFFMCNLFVLVFWLHFIIQPIKLYNTVIILLLGGDCHQISYSICNKCGHIQPYFSNTSGQIQTRPTLYVNIFKSIKTFKKTTVKS